MMAGRDRVVAGSLKNTAQVAAATMLPEPTKAALHAQKTEPGSGKE
jgi:uncharacterized protein